MGVWCRLQVDRVHWERVWIERSGNRLGYHGMWLGVTLSKIEVISTGFVV